MTGAHFAKLVSTFDGSFVIGHFSFDLFGFDGFNFDQFDFDQIILMNK